MILVDTSIWVDHLRGGDARLADLLQRGGVVMHPFVLGEIACGSLADRSSILDLLRELPSSLVADGDEVLGFVERHRLHGKGIGYVDVHLLASAALTAGTSLWTRDRSLRTAAESLGLALRDASSAH